MSKLFQEIIAIMLDANIKFELNHGIENNYYLVRLQGSEIVWEIDDRPDDNKIYLYDERDNRRNSDYGVNYANLKSYIESITQAIDTYKTS